MERKGSLGVLDIIRACRLASQRYLVAERAGHLLLSFSFFLLFLPPFFPLPRGPPTAPKAPDFFWCVGQ